MTPLEARAAGLYEGIVRGNRSDLARGISVVENGAEEARYLLQHAYRSKFTASVTGLTGAPGVGKSTMVDGLVSLFRRTGLTVGVIAVDPSSPFTGGAILGDRVRMRSHTVDTGVFYRSLASRGHLGGVSRHTGDVMALMNLYGFSEIIVETVGTGQSEVDIMRYADTVVVTLAPGLGDDVQAIKAGILEIGDVFCINKADLPGADKARREIEMMLHLREPGGWFPPVVETVAAGGQGLEELLSAIESHRQYLSSVNLREERRRGAYMAVLEEYLHGETVEAVLRDSRLDGTLEKILHDLASGFTDPRTAARLLVDRYLK